MKCAMIRQVAWALLGLASGVASAAPTVSEVAMSQDANRLITVTYKLAEGPGIITIDIQTNAVANAATGWQSIGKENLGGINGDVYRLVQPTESSEVRTIRWNPVRFWPGNRVEAGKIRAVVQAWATDAPPDYCIVHLVAPYDVTYYPYKELVPGGIADKRYKGEYMAFRKIPAAGVTWWAGGVNYPFSQLHQVKLTEDYYMAVYELTWSQWSAIDGGAPSDDRRPLVGWGWGRNNYRGSDLGAKWPTFNEDGSLDYEKSHGVDPGSPLGILRGRSGLQFDLPTEAQWEYAARAGSPGESYTDETQTSSTTADGLRPIARFYTNRKEADCEGRVNDGGGTAVVGSYLPNAWGLYDVLGNASEICLDRVASFATLYPDGSKVYVDPVGASEGDKSVGRGRSYEVPAGREDWSVSISSRGATTKISEPSDSTLGARFCINLH